MSRVVTVVCRHNQARSVMAAAALRRYFPNVEVASAGVAGVEGQRIPQSILNLADAWGLEVLDLVSHSLEAMHERLLHSDFVVVAEDEFILNIVELGVASNKVLSMQDERFDHSVIPFDPIGQGERVLSVELAKAIMTTMQLLREELGSANSFPVEAVFTLDESDLLNKLGIVWEKMRSTNGAVIVSDFRAPNLKSVHQVCDTVLELSVSRIDQKISFSDGSVDWELERVLTHPGPLAISGRFELDQVEKFTLSPQFTNLVSTLAASRAISIITEPQGLGPCGYLAGANANF